MDLVDAAAAFVFGFSFFGFFTSLRELLPLAMICLSKNAAARIAQNSAPGSIPKIGNVSGLQTINHFA